MTGWHSMADQEPFLGMTQEETLQAILLMLSQIVGKMPRADTANRLIVTHTETEGYTMLTRMGSTSGSPASARPTDLMAVAMSNIGAAHIYDRIEVL